MDYVEKELKGLINKRQKMIKADRQIEKKISNVTKQLRKINIEINARKRKERSDRLFAVGNLVSDILGTVDIDEEFLIGCLCVMKTWNVGGNNYKKYTTRGLEYFRNGRG